MERLQKEMNCESPSLSEAPYFWPYFSNRKQRQKLAEMQQMSSSEQEESIVEQLADEDNVVESVVVEEPSLNNDLPVWSNDTSNQEDESITTYHVICPNTSALEDTAAVENIVQDNGQYVIHDTSSFDDNIQDAGVHHTQDISQDTDEELTDQEVEDYIRQLLLRGVSTVRSHAVVMVMTCY